MCILGKVTMETIIVVAHKDVLQFTQKMSVHFFQILYGLIPNKQQEYQMDVFLLLELNEKEI